MQRGPIHLPQPTGTLNKKKQQSELGQNKTLTNNIKFRRTVSKVMQQLLPIPFDNTVHVRTSTRATKQLVHRLKRDGMENAWNDEIFTEKNKTCCSLGQHKSNLYIIMKLSLVQLLLVAQLLCNCVVIISY